MHPNLFKTSKNTIFLKTILSFRILSLTFNIIYGVHDKCKIGTRAKIWSFCAIFLDSNIADILIQNTAKIIFFTTGVRLYTNYILPFQRLAILRYFFKSFIKSSFLEIRKKKYFNLILLNFSEVYNRIALSKLWLKRSGAKSVQP